MLSRSRIIRLESEVKRKQPKDNVCIFFYNHDDPNKENVLKNHLKICKKENHIFLPHYKGRLMVPKG